jgi:hypothetical protein
MSSALANYDAKLGEARLAEVLKFKCYTALLMSLQPLSRIQQSAIAFTATKAFGQC